MFFKCVAFYVLQKMNLVRGPHVSLVEMAEWTKIVLLDLLGFAGLA